MKPCEHCGIPDRTRWRVACAWMTPGVTRPCAVESQMEFERAGRRETVRDYGAVTLVLVVFAVISVTAYVLSRGSF